MHLCIIECRGQEKYEVQGTLSSPLQVKVYVDSVTVKVRGPLERKRSNNTLFPFPFCPGFRCSLFTPCWVMAQLPPVRPSLMKFDYLFHIFIYSYSYHTICQLVFLARL